MAKTMSKPSHLNKLRLAAEYSLCRTIEKCFTSTIFGCWRLLDVCTFEDCEVLDNVTLGLLPSNGVMCNLMCHGSRSVHHFTSCSHSLQYVIVNRASANEIS